MSKISIGIDPGSTGFISVFNNEYAKWTHYSIPLLGKEIDLYALDKIFYQLSTLSQQGNEVHCVIEDVHAIFGSSAKSTFSFGKIVGVLQAFVIAHRIPYTLVTPKTWQKELWQGVAIQKKQSSTGKTQVNNTKAMSEIAAKRLFPDLDLRATERCKINHDGKIDSILLAEYCHRKF